jgi:PST family polysaccharide transporter
MSNSLTGDPPAHQERPPDPAGNLRTQTIHGVGWTAGIQIGRQLITFLLSLFLARTLARSDFGLLGMVTIFTGFITLVGEMGFANALVQRESLEERHFSSIFWLNVVVGVTFTILLMALSPLVAAFYGEPILRWLTMAVALNFTINSLSVVQRARLSRAMHFRLLGLVEIVAVLIGGLIAIGLAIAGFGVWSLVLQTLSAATILALGLWWATGWQPRWLFDRAAVGDLLGFSSNLLGFSAFNYWTRNGDNFLVGKFLGADALGLYVRAYSLMLLPISQITAVLSKVMFPALSKIQHDKVRVKRVYLRSVSLIALMTFPMMVGLLVVSEHLIPVIYGPKWTGMIRTFQILCLVGMIQSIGSTVGWIYQSQGRTDLMLRWGLFAGTLVLLSFGIGVYLGSIETMALAYTLTSTLLLPWSFNLPGRLIDLHFGDVLHALLDVSLCAALMALVVWAVGWLLPTAWPHWAYLLTQSAVGLVTYPALLIGGRAPTWLAARAFAAEYRTSLSKRPNPAATLVL